MRANVLALSLLLTATLAHAEAAPSPPAARFVNRSAAGGEGTRKSPWIGWESAFASIPASGCEIRFAKGFYSKTLPIDLPVNLEGELRIVGEPGSEITLTDTTAGRRLFDIAKVADYDVFRNVVIEGIRLDANQVTNRQAVLIGNYKDGVTTTRLSFEKITIRKCYVYNVLTDPDFAKNHVGFVRLTPTTTGGESQVVFARDILIEQLAMYGGNWGVLITSGPTPKTLIDRVTIRDSVHDMRSKAFGVQPKFFPSTCFHVGSYALVGSASLQNDACFAPGDNCFEINNAQQAEMRSLSCRNPIATGFTLKNFVVPTDLANQRYLVADSAVVFDAGLPSGGGYTARGITANSAPLDFGSLEIVNFNFESKGRPVLNPAFAISAGTPAAGFRALTVNGLTVRLNWKRDGTVDVPLSDIYFDGEAKSWSSEGGPELPRVVVHDVSSEHSHVETEGTISHRVLWIAGSADLDVEGIVSRTDGSARDAFEVIRIADGIARTITGKIRNVTVLHPPGSPGTPKALHVAGTSAVTISPELILESVGGSSATNDGVDPTNRNAIRVVRRGG
jgi:hypothetical protein